MSNQYDVQIILHCLRLICRKGLPVAPDRHNIRVVGSGRKYGKLGGHGKFVLRPRLGRAVMASVYGIVRSIARAGAAGPMLRNMVGLKPTPPKAEPTPGIPGFAALVESVIIPRLVVAHSNDDSFATATGQERATISADEALAFAPRALECDACHLLDDVEAFLDRGVCVDRIFVDLLAPAARHLGTMWEEDDADFVAVTMALWRLQEVVRELSARVPVRSGGPMRRALFR